MKKSSELLGLPIFSIEEGKGAGHVYDLIIDPNKGTVEYLIVSNGIKYLGLKVLPFKNVEGVGEHALTITNVSLIVDFSEVPDINALLEKDVQVKGTKVITQKGNVLGNVSEFIIDEDKEGLITGCILVESDESAEDSIISNDKVVTFGKDVLVVSNDVGEGLPQKLHVTESKATNTSPTQKMTIPASPSVKEEKTAINKQNEGQNNVEPTKIFEDRQKQYLVGKITNKKIISDTNEVLVEEGTVLTQEMIEKTSNAGKLLELIMNTRSN